MSVGQKLSGQMQKLTSDDVYGVNGSMEEKIQAGSVGMRQLQTDPRIIKYAEVLDPQGVADARVDFYKHNPANAPFELPRYNVSMALTYATQGESNDPAEQKLMNEIADLAKGVHDNPYLRQNCYAFAVEGANRNSANPLGIGAIPGNVAMGAAAFDNTMDPATLIKRVEMDGAVAAGSDPNKLDIPKGMRLVALYSYGGDYHFNRIDMTADGTKIAMTGKDGIKGHEGEILQREFNIDDAFDPDKTNVMNYSRTYKFQQFFYIPEEGLNVGIDAHLIKTGKMDPKKPDESVEDYGKRVDVAFHQEMQNKDQSPEIAQQQTQMAKVENQSISPGELQNRMAGVEPLEGSFQGQKQENVFKQIFQYFSSVFTAEGPSNERNMAQPQANQMNRNPGMSGPAMEMGA